MAGYGHPMAFKAMNDEHILKMEKFIREKTLNILQQNINQSVNEEQCEDCEVLLDDDELRDYFGDLYAQNPSSFQFEAGDVLLIKELINHVKTVADRNGKNTGLGHFAKCNTESLNAGKIRRNRKANLFPQPKKKKQAFSHLDENQLKIELEQKALASFNSYVTEGINSEQVIVQVHQENGKVYGEIVCVLCDNNKPKRVSFNPSQTHGCWVLSNLVKHLESVHGLHSMVKTVDYSVQEIKHDKNSVEEQINANLNGDASLIIVEECSTKGNEVKRDDPEQLYTQLSAQITKVTSAVLRNGDQEEEIKFTLNKAPKKLSVAVIPGDGSCLYGALAHQLWMYKIDGQKHIEATKQLRADVVEHILSNFSFFEHHIKDRVYEVKNSKEITDMSMECKMYVRHVLSNAKTWGGVETLLAVSNLYSTNIVVFNEDGICTKYKKADECYARSITIAHRFGLNAEGLKIRNHYDSVFDVNASDLHSSARYVAK